MHCINNVLVVFLDNWTQLSIKFSEHVKVNCFGSYSIYRDHQVNCFYLYLRGYSVLAILSLY